MRNMVATVIVFGFIFILILGAAFFFQKMHGLDTLKSADEAIDRNVRSFIDRADNISADGESAKDTGAGLENGTSESFVQPVREANENFPSGSISEDKVVPDDNSSDNENIFSPGNDYDSDKTGDNFSGKKNESGDQRNQSEKVDSGFLDNFGFSQNLKIAADDLNEKFRRFVEDDPFGKSVKNLGNVIKKDADNVSEKLSDNFTRGDEH